MLALMAGGRTNFEIAQELGLTLEGAKYHVSEVLGKLAVESREEAIAIAKQRGWAWPKLPRMRVLAPLGVLGALAAGVALSALLLGSSGSTKGPDHVWVALTHTSPGDQSNLEVVDATAGTHHTIGSPGVTYGRVEWSPDGSRILGVALARQPSGNNDVTLHLFRADDGWKDTTIELQLTAPADLAWAPDSQHFVFTASPTRIFDRDGRLVFTSPDLPASTANSGGSVTPIWAPDSSRLIGDINGHEFVFTVDGNFDEIVAPPELQLAKFRFVGWKDATTAIGYDSAAVPNAASPGPPRAFAVNFATNPPTWAPGNINSTLERLASTTSSSAAVPIASAAPAGNEFHFAGTTADGRGLVFGEIHRVPSTGELLKDAVLVYVDGMPTRIALPADASAGAPDVNSVVIAPAR